MHESSAIDYGDPYGDIDAVTLMASVMSTWYKTDVSPQNVLFTIGGIGALRILFETFNSLHHRMPGYRILTPFPHYSAYANYHFHCLHPIEVMNTPGYKLTAKEVEKSILEAYDMAKIDHKMPVAVLICNPSNPLGNIIATQELEKIVTVLERYPDLYVIFDEAYAEMCYVDMPSFLELAPHLKKRTIILRSATKPCLLLVSVWPYS